MTPGIVVGQLVHGYARGHELLGASRELADEDADLAAQLSDLSGMPVEERTPSYVTCYPLPSGTLYAVAGTWMDDEAPRGGCVLTHTLLVPMADWCAGLSARALMASLRKPSPPAREFPGRPRRLDPVEVGQQVSRREGAAVPSSPRSDEFVVAYFGRGRKPSVWLDGPPDADLASLLLDFAWPSLRRDISLCTYALKPRSILGRPFDVQFAPRSAAGRFSNVPERNIIGLSPKPGPEPSGRDARLTSRVSAELAAIDAHGTTWRWDTYARLRVDLPRNPDAPMKLVVLDEMQEKAVASPTAAVAVLDALAAIVPGMDDGLPDKGAALEVALVQALTQAPAFAVELLGAIADRCSKLAFRRQSGKRRRIIEHISRFVALDPLACLFTVSRTRGRHLSLMTGVAAGLAVGGGDGAVHLDRLEAVRPDIVDTLIRLRPELVTLYLRVHADLAVGDDGASEADVQVIAWLRRSTDARRRTLAKVIARSSPVPLYATVLAGVLPYLSRNDLRHLMWAILDAVASDVAGFRTDAIWSMLDGVTRAYPVEIRDAVTTLGMTSYRMARLWARTFANKHEGSQALSEVGTTNPCARSLALAALIDVWGPDLLDTRPVGASPRWVTEILRNRCARNTPEVGRLLLALLERGDNRDLVLDLSPVDCEDNEFGARTSSLLAEVVVESVVVAFCSGQIDHARMSAWMRDDVLVEALRGLQTSKVVAAWNVARHRAVGQGAWAVRVWQWLVEAAPAMRRYRDGVDVDLVVWAFDQTASAWDSGMTSSWSAVVMASRADEGQERIGAIEAHAISTALTHCYLPLSPLLVTSFPRLYRLALRDQPVFSLFTLWFPDWDKAKQLRKRLVSASLESQWPAGDLALAADGAQILDKIVSRLRRKGHENYLDAMIIDLRRREGTRALEVAGKTAALRSESSLGLRRDASL